MSVRLEEVHPVLTSSDVPASIAFFVKLGFNQAFVDDPSAPRYAAVRRDNVELHLQWHDYSGSSVQQDRPVYRFVVSDVDALYAEFVGTRAFDAAPQPSTPWAQPGDTPWGTREFHLHDPDHNGLQFYRPL
jgi:catechol 2,3-dioxygenase-like lactoylglutathione lyase family enzyme